jgi:hypothetical protein
MKIQSTLKVGLKLLVLEDTSGDDDEMIDPCNYKGIFYGVEEEKYVP